MDSKVFLTDYLNLPCVSPVLPLEIIQAIPYVMHKELFQLDLACPTQPFTVTFSGYLQGLVTFLTDNNKTCVLSLVVY